MRWKRGSILLLLGVVAAIVVLEMDRKPGPVQEKTREPEWVINPKSPGGNLPAAGRSLFDFLLAEAPDGKVPFPFSELMKMIERHSPRPKAVLIPIGRSLQRMASAPDFFAFPRIVVAADSEGDDAFFALKDRLFLGYNERAGIIEVISYNEAAGRFEFQIVKDYREGAVPKVFYANRAVCVSCHQNAGAIFSRPLWDETSANTRIASRLQDTRHNYFGISAAEGVDAPNEIDDATDRANLFALYQLLWREGCEDEACRGELLLNLVQYRLSGKLDAEKWERKWSARWPQGLGISNPDIPNRDPLLNANVPLHEVSADMEALNLREPLEIWLAQDSTARALAGFSEFISASDIARLDQSLVSRPSRVSQHESMCEFARGEGHVLDFQCTGGFAAEGRLYLDRDQVKRGRIDRLALGTAQLRGLQMDSGGPDSLKLKRGNLNARLPDGNAIEHLHFAWGQKAGQKFSGTAVLAVQEDFVSVRTAIGQLVEQKHDVLSAKPFRGASVIRAITPSLTFPGTPSFPPGEGKEPEAPISAGWRGVGGEDRGGGHGPGVPEACCKDKLSLPELDSVEGGLTVAKDATQGFQRWCANCHRSNDRFPPNFLAGDASKVQTKLEHCAERIYVRLAMHDVPAQDRAKTPMPPAVAREGLEAAELHALRDHAASIIKSQRGRLPALDELLLPGYENLRQCLPS